MIDDVRGVAVAHLQMLARAFLFVLVWYVPYAFITGAAFDAVLFASIVIGLVLLVDAVFVVVYKFYPSVYSVAERLG